MVKKYSNLNAFKDKEQKSSAFGQMLMENTEDTVIDETARTYSLEQINIDNLIFDSVPEIEQTVVLSILEMMVNPIIVSFDYTLEQKAGYPYKNKNGNYKIVDGIKRATIYKQALEKAKAENDEEGIRKYSKINALVIPIDTEEEDISKIKDIASKNKTISSIGIVEDVRLNEGKEITYGYLYERAKISVDKLIERDNKYSIVQEEVEALAESIYKYGLFNDIMVLPIINENNEVAYQIQAGHKRTRAIKLLLEKARTKQLLNGKFIIDNYSQIYVKLLPLGATKEQIDAVYNESNILGRHLNSAALFAHLDYFKCVPKLPETQTEFDNMKKTLSISKLAKEVQTEFKKIGIADWKSRAITSYLNIYLYGSDKLKELVVESIRLKEGKPIISIKDLDWIAVTYKEWAERKEQDEIIDETMKDRNYLVVLKNKNKTKKSRTLRVSTTSIVKQILSDKNRWHNLTNADIELVKTSKKDVIIALSEIENTKKLIISVEKRLKEIQKEQE